MDDDPQIMAGGIPLIMPTAKDAKLFMLIWGDSGSGKTTLAATAPGKKLLILFDPGGHLSLAEREDVAVLDLTTQAAANIVSQFRTADPYNLGKILELSPEIETVVVDSMTSLAYIALQSAVTQAGGKSSIEQPGQHGYQVRNSILLRVTMALMRLCGIHKRHLILVTHEGFADRNDDGNVISITMALSDSVANQVGLRFNEVWHLSDTGTEHRIMVRPARLRRPMKTRLFNADKSEFVWHYNPDTQIGDGIADWYHEWQAGGGKKLPLPTWGKATTSRGGTKK